VTSSDPLPPPIDPGSMPPVPPTGPRRWSKLAIAAGLFGLPSSILVLVLPGWLFQRLVAFEMEGVGPVFGTLFVAVWAGFVGGILGGLGVRRHQGPEPLRRGRAGAFLASTGSRALLMVVAGALGSVVLGRGEEPAGEPEFLWPRRIAGLAATLLVVGLYLRARHRALGRARAGRGWWVFAGGILLHLLLIAALPVSFFQAFATFRPEVVRGGGQNRRYEGPREPGSYAQRPLRLVVPEGVRVRWILRLWEGGTPRELDRWEVDGQTVVPLEWFLLEDPANPGELRLRQAGPSASHQRSWPVGLPTGADLAPVIEPATLRIQGGSKTNLWLFQDFSDSVPLGPEARPARAIELRVESEARP